MKKITSLSLGLSFLIMTYTGIILFLCPHGRVAYWSEWHLLGLSKNQYGELHTTSMIAMVLFGILHISYNWNSIVNYMKNKSKQISFTKKEFLIALGINIFFIVGTLNLIQPFKAFLDFEENFKNSWINQYSEPPYGHAEQSKLKIFCKKMNISIEMASKKLKENNIKFKIDDTLKDIAKKNNLIPSDVYNLIKVIDTKSDIPRLGKKTLQELAELDKIDLTKSIQILKSKGLSDITKESKIKNIADELDMMPIEAYKIIKKHKG